MKNLFLALVLMISISSFSQTCVLLQNGKSDFVVVNCNTQDAGSLLAIGAFHNYFKQITSIQLSVVKCNENPAKAVRFILLPENESKLLKEEGYVIEITPNQLIFKSKSGKGLQNAVYTFFEKYLDCHYFSNDCVVVPVKTKIELKTTVYTDNPAFDFRVINGYQPYQPEYQKWNKLHNAPVVEGKRSGISEQFGRYWVHTFTKLVPPEEFFATHPEYYALRNGIRSTSQICLSNPDVLEIVIKNLGIEIEKNPKAKLWSVSQDDNYNYCQCDKCSAIDKIEGSPSGSIIRFVNEVAKKFPNKTISTLAYQYSRSAPKVTIPLANVNIMLCTIECDRSKPLSVESEKGSFVADLKDWAAISNNIMVWDYIVNFYNSLMPFPNFPVLAPNLKLFKENNVSMVFEQGFTTQNTELNDMRCFLLTKLLWNPDLNTDSLKDIFLKGYYGPAAPFILQYITLTETELKKSGKGLSIYLPPNQYSTSYLSPDLMRKYFEILENAKNAVSANSLYSLHVENVIQQVRYAWLEVCRNKTHSTDWLFEQDASLNFVAKKSNVEMLTTMCNHARANGPEQFDERRLSPDVYEKRMLDYFKNGVSTNYRKVNKISYLKPYSPKYLADGNNTLIDGVFGVMNYNSLWLGWENADMEAVLEFKETTEVKTVKMNLMYMHESWILLPKKVIISFSNDGKTFKDTAVWIDPNGGNKMDKQIVECKITLSKPIKSKYMKVYIEKYGEMPDWTGVKGDAWFFVDEIDVE